MSSDVAGFIQQLFQKKGIEVPKGKATLFQTFAAGKVQRTAFDEISTIQTRIMLNWKRTNQIDDIKSKAVQIPNARVGKRYGFTLDPVAMGLDGVKDFELANYEASGLQWDAETATLSGTPTTPGEYRLVFRFHAELSDADAGMEEKEIALIVNADPKSLWQNLPSNENDPYHKSDSASATLPIADRKVVVASNRGRSHAHEGKFRDDDFRVTNIGNTGWALIAVADGAGSAKFSRQGSLIACTAVADYFGAESGGVALSELEAAILAAQTEDSEDNKKALSQLVMSQMGKAAYAAHTTIGEEATRSEATIKDYSTTLLFALIKKFDFGYSILSFWVGDGGIGIYDRAAGTVAVLGTPDGGEFAGQTRFVTMPDIFTTPEFYKRMSIRTVPDFTALMLMTDGITDPKFSTDAALTRIEKWNELWDDLGGANEDNARVIFDQSNENIEREILTWLDFWSPGNHDDRTIAILF